MLRFITSDSEDTELLESSYNAIRQKDGFQIVIDEEEKKKIFRQTVNVISIPANGTISFINLFKIVHKTYSYYIAQCMIDFGYPLKGSIWKYDFQAIGIARLNIDLGNTTLRPETKTDKIIGRFFDSDIDFTGAELFNDKYYLVSNKKDTVLKVWDNDFLMTIAKYDNVLLTTRGYDLYITFTTELKIEHTKVIADILSTCKFLEKFIS